MYTDISVQIDGEKRTFLYGKSCWIQKELLGIVGKYIVYMGNRRERATGSPISTGFTVRLLADRFMINGRFAERDH
jgi:hypothetical protein